VKNKSFSKLKGLVKKGVIEEGEGEHKEGFLPGQRMAERQPGMC
jgi:hypothetical protein